MLKLFVLYKYLLIYILIFNSLVNASTISARKNNVSSERVSKYLSIPYSNHEIIKNYRIYKKQFSKQLCAPKVETKFWELYRNYQSVGHYLPVLPDGKLDKETIAFYLRSLRNKTLWIGEELLLLKSKNKLFFKKSLQILDNLRKDLNKLIDLKSKFTVTLSKKLRHKLTTKSQKLSLEFKKDSLRFFKTQSYLLSYNYPLDHLKMRTKYDKYKGRKDLKGKKMANNIYFYRQIVQDGTIAADGIGGDRSVRAVIDSLTLDLKNQESIFISENNRFDLSYLFDKYEKFIKLGKKRIMKSLSHWKKRSILKEKFYRGLLVESRDNLKRVDSILLKKGTSRYELKDYVLKKEADSFYFWHSKEEIFRALFSIETILFGEVGNFEGFRSSERKDIVRVILNRSKIAEYSQILDDNMIKPYLTKLFKNKSYLKYRWLNLLLKEGEFSFSYYFLSGNLRIYCPSLTRKAKSLERKNISIALNILRSFNGEFKGVRYFSRASMHGRIDMSSLWHRFSIVPERLGTRVSYWKKLKKLYDNGDYKDLYSFKSIDGLPYRVIEIKKVNYVLPYGKQVFYHHRNPHYFKYFIEK